MGFSRQIFVQYPNIKISFKKSVQWEPSLSIWMDGWTDGRTGGHDEAKKSENAPTNHSVNDI